MIVFKYKICSDGYAIIGLSNVGMSCMDNRVVTASCHIRSFLRR